MVSIQPIHVNLPATKIKITGFGSSVYPVTDNSLIFTIGFFDENDIMIKTEQVSLLQSEYDAWGSGEEGEDYIIDVCIAKLDIEVAV